MDFNMHKKILVNVGSCVLKQRLNERIERQRDGDERQF